MDDSQCFPNHRSLLATFLPLLLVLGVISPVLAVDGVIEISQASTGGALIINQPGSYRLTSDLRPPSGVSGILILSSHVTLDLNGFSIIGDPNWSGQGAADGIFAGALDIEIRNGSIRWFSRHGVFSNNATNYVRLIGVRSMGNQISGIQLQGFGNIVDGCTASLNGIQGMRVEGGLIVNSVAEQNVGLGLVMSNKAGYRSNILTENNGGNANPQTTATGIQLGSNNCGGDLVCP